MRFAEVLEMADRHVVFKQCLKEIAESMGMSVTFMAKFAADGAGSSCHIHFSLWRDGKNAFAGGPDAFKHFLGGWIAHVPDVMVFYAPTVNSYKVRRRQWAPTPRLEQRQPHRGLPRRRLGRQPAHRMPHPGRGLQSLSRARRVPRLRARRHREQDRAAGGVRRRHLPGENLPRVPYTPSDAIDLFEKSAFAKKMFGEAVHGHYTHFYRTEAQAYDRAVTDWERRRYFERI